MITDKMTITTDSLLMYAGKTKNYVYFYNRKSEQARVFKADDIIEIRYSKGKDYRKDKSKTVFEYMFM